MHPAYTHRSLATRIGAGLLTLALLAGCSGSPASNGGTQTPSQPTTKQEVVVANVADIIQLDPTDIGDDPSSLVAQQVMEWLVNRNQEGGFEPALAEDWSTSEDGLVWTFNLRKDVKFHDGSDFTADVVKWHYDRVLFDENAPTRFRKQWGDIIKEVKVVDSHTVEMHLKAPNAAFLDMVVTTNGGMIPSKANFDKLGAKDAALNPVGTGPYTFKEWVAGQRTVLEPNPSYWGEKAKVEKLIFRPISESNTAVIELETGGVHLISKLNQEDVDRLKANDEVAFEAVPGNNVRALFLNVNRAPFDDVKVRQAVQYAIDAKGIVTSLVGDLATPSQSAFLPTASWAHPEEGKLTTYAQDIAKAKALLAEAGYTEGADGKMTKDGKPLTFTLNTPNGRYFMDKEISEVVKNQLGQIGIDVNIQVLEWAPFVENMQKADFDMVFLGWSQGSGEPSIFFDPLIKTGGRGNYAGFSDAEIDAWLTEAVTELDHEKREALYAKVANKAADLAWAVPLYNEAKVGAHRNELKGYQVSPASDHLYDIYLEAAGN